MSAVLIVDDDERIRNLLARWLRSAGYETCEAADAETGLERLLAGGCDVAGCDVIMPGRGGLWLGQGGGGAGPGGAAAVDCGWYSGCASSARRSRSCWPPASSTCIPRSASAATSSSISSSRSGG